MNIEFKEDEHKYLVDDKVADLSVTELLSKHRLAPDYSKVNKSLLTKSAEYGTAIHKDLELVLNEGKYEPMTPEGEQFAEWVKDNLISGVGEQMVAIKYKDLVVAGTTDFIGITKDNEFIIGDHKTTSTIHTDSVAWQLSLYDYALRHIGEVNGRKINWSGAKRFVCLHYSKGVFSVKDIEPINDMEIERLLECEVNGDFYTQPDLIVKEEFMQKFVEAENLLLETKARYEQADKDSKALREKLKEMFEEQGIKSWETDKFKVTYVAEKTRVGVDGTSLKKDHPDIYARYSKETKIKASVQITKKKESNND